MTLRNGEADENAPEGNGPPGTVMRPKAGWSKRRLERGAIWEARRGQDLEQLLSWIGGDRAGVEDIGKVLATMNGHFAYVIKAPGVFIAAVDKNRSIPLFYRDTQSGFLVGNCARTLSGYTEPVLPDTNALREMEMAGYVTGGRTAVRGLKQLLPGEFLIWTDSEPEVRIRRYHRYLPRPEPGMTEAQAEPLAELSRVTDEVFRWVVDTAGGRPIWIPLSAGLDSRLVLAKLHELGYRNLHTYSYGVPNNQEARIAESVARRLGITWEFVPLNVCRSRQFFWSSARERYWELADGLSTVPALQDVAMLQGRRERGEIPSDAIFINGQSGDFITGGHVPKGLLSPAACESDVVRAIISKHFALWENLRTDDILEVVRLSIAQRLEEIGKSVPDALAPPALYESWEWQERQCKYVVNAVRMYEYADLDWLMPLWHGAYVDFWTKVPFQLKEDQKLYKAYLRAWNYAGLFESVSRKSWRWPGLTIAALPIGAILGKVVGPQAKSWFYRRARYFGYYRFVYGIYGLREFLRWTDSARNPVSFMAKTWVDEFKTRHMS